MDDNCKRRSIQKNYIICDFIKCCASTHITSTSGRWWETTHFFRFNTCNINSIIIRFYLIIYKALLLLFYYFCTCTFFLFLYLYENKEFISKNSLHVFPTCTWYICPVCTLCTVFYTSYTNHQYGQFVIEEDKPFFLPWFINKIYDK